MPAAREAAIHHDVPMPIDPRASLSSISRSAAGVRRVCGYGMQSAAGCPVEQVNGSYSEYPLPIAVCWCSAKFSAAHSS